MFRREPDKVLALVDGTVDKLVGMGGSVGWNIVDGNGGIDAAWLWQGLIDVWGRAVPFPWLHFGVFDIGCQRQARREPRSRQWFFLTWSVLDAGLQFSWGMRCLIL